LSSSGTSGASALVDPFAFVASGHDYCLDRVCPASPLAATASVFDVAPGMLVQPVPPAVLSGVRFFVASV
jgi:hypothetical protein